MDSNDSPYLHTEAAPLSERLSIAHQKSYANNEQIARYLLQTNEEGGMTLLGLRQLANTIGVKKPENVIHPVELVRAIQITTYHAPCFRSEVSASCKQADCTWRHECKKLVAEWCR